MNMNQPNIDYILKNYIPSPDGAYPTGRCLPGIYQRENMQEWAENAILDGAKITIYYLFENYECEHEDGSNMDFNRDKISSIEFN